MPLVGSIKNILHTPIKSVAYTTGFFGCLKLLKIIKSKVLTFTFYHGKIDS